MGSGIYIATAGAESQSNALDVTANNIANASTAGYRASRVSFSAALTNAKSADASFVGVGETAPDTSAGSLTQTDNPLDLALVGDGFFSVETPNGVRYTRAGAFRLDGEGRIVSSDGHPALSAGGGSLQIPAGTAEITVGAQGEVLADGNEVGRLALARFARGNLAREGANLFVANGQPLAGDQPEVVSGAIEGSNVNVVRGMVDLVRVSRTYESLMRMIEGYRQIESRAARDLGGPK